MCNQVNYTSSSVPPLSANAKLPLGGDDPANGFSFVGAYFAGKFVCWASADAKKKVTGLTRWYCSFEHLYCVAACTRRGRRENIVKGVIN